MPPLPLCHPAERDHTKWLPNFDSTIKIPITQTNELDIATQGLLGGPEGRACVVDEPHQGGPIHESPDIRCSMADCSLIGHIEKKRCEIILELRLQSLCICLLPHAQRLQEHGAQDHRLRYVQVSVIYVLEASCCNGTLCISAPAEYVALVANQRLCDGKTYSR